MKILFGLYTADEGTITFEGSPLEIDSPAAAIEAGIGMIHQHFMLVNTFTVTENVALGLGTSDMGAVRERLTEHPLRSNGCRSVSSPTAFWTRFRSIASVPRPLVLSNRMKESAGFSDLQHPSALQNGF